MNQNNFTFYNTWKYKLSLCLSTSLFFYFFLIFFLPFGVDNYNPNHIYTATFLLEIANFAIGILIFSVLNEFLLRPIFIKSTTQKNILIWSVWTLIMLATVIFYIYNYLGNWHDYSFNSYLGFIVNTTAVMVFPIVGTFFFYRYRNLQQTIELILTTKEEFMDSNQLIQFKGQGSKDQISLSASKFLYGRAQDNYVDLYYLEQDSLKKFLIRSSLRDLVQSVNFKAINRCHRSYMVNLLHVDAVKGSRKEMTLHLDHFHTDIPVSNSYQEAILNGLADLKNFN
jgi:hypothetical protein